jgi:hypothetical protein
MSARPLGPFRVAILYKQVAPVKGDGFLIQSESVLSETGRPRTRTEFVDIQRDFRREDDHIIGDGDHLSFYPSRGELGAQIKQDLAEVRGCR